MEYKRLPERLWKLIDALPVALPVMIAAFGTVAIILLLLGQLTSVLVWSLGLAAATVAGFLVLRCIPWDEDKSRERRVSNLVIIAGVIVWGMFNSLYASQHIFTNRDPAAYALAGVWLSQHDTLRIDNPRTLQEIEGMDTSSAGFTKVQGDTENLYVRGPHLFSIFLGLAGRIGGVPALLHVNPVFGAMAILALYGFARLVVRLRWAVMASVAFAVSLPLIYFSRDTYTEPLLTTLTLGMFSLLWHAQVTGRKSLWFLAGLMAGAGTLVRIDGYLTIVTIMTALVIFLVLAKKVQRRTALQKAGWLACGAALTSVLGWLNMELLTGGYLTRHMSQFLLEVGAIGIVAALGTVLIILTWRYGWLARIDRATRRWRAPAIFVIVVLAAIIVASRPLWFTSYTATQGGVISSLQRQQGLAVAPRDYVEQTVNWVAWYMGPILLIAGCIGVALTAARAMRRRDVLLVASTVTVLGISFLYFIKPSIFADQIWAVRRFLPVTIPGLLIFAAVALQKLSEYKKAAIAAWGIAVLGIAAPLVVSWPFLTTRTYASYLQTIDHVCKALPKNAVVVWIGLGRTEALQPTRLFCRVPVAGYGKAFSRVERPSREVFRRVAASAAKRGQVPIVALYDESRRLLKPGDQWQVVHSSVSADLEQSLLHAPQKIVEKDVIVLLGKIMPDGSTTALER